MNATEITTKFLITMAGIPTNAKYGELILDECDDKRFGGVTNLRAYCTTSQAAYAVFEMETGMIVYCEMDMRGKITRVYSEEPSI
jgi:hypothetical protein